MRMMPERTSISSNSGQARRNSLIFGVGAEAHDVLDAGAVVPAAVEQHDLAARRQLLRHSAGNTIGRARARSGVGSATMRQERGLRHSAMRLMTPPLPAASRPSKITTTCRPSSRTHSCSFKQLELQPGQLVDVVIVFARRARRPPVAEDMPAALQPRLLAGVAQDRATDLYFRLAVLAHAPGSVPSRHTGNGRAGS